MSKKILTIEDGLISQKDVAFLLRYKSARQLRQSIAAGIGIGGIGTVTIKDSGYWFDPASIFAVATELLPYLDFSDLSAIAVIDWSAKYTVLKKYVERIKSTVN